MAVQRVPLFTACRHEGTTRLASGALACVECGYEWPAPKEPEWRRRMRAGEFVGKEAGISGWAGTADWHESERRFAAGDR
jgi:hypothetical protein